MNVKHPNPPPSPTTEPAEATTKPCCKERSHGIEPPPRNGRESRPQASGCCKHELEPQRHEPKHAPEARRDSGACHHEAMAPSSGRQEAAGADPGAPRHDSAGHCCHQAPHKPRSAAEAARLTEIEHICPMHPEVRQIGPGTCPKCGMALEP
ncbi:MAG: hypothetical protein KC766_13650, partial [Myxococcales bacterium]|nr:hypothetical protein [Myxococcales bacterium]